MTTGDSWPDAQARILIEQASIDAIDEEIISLIIRRDSHCKAVERARISEVRSRTDVARENLIIHRYHSRIGSIGTVLAVSLIRSCRGYT
ncbi:chorismate mutase [Kitasatospora purpeofusca]|uniref:chorismate mutase n=1 Tax=Kitasatospora purpeofusca TaxID=67352 RepID=UPI003685A203